MSGDAGVRRGDAGIELDSVLGHMGFVEKELDAGIGLRLAPNCSLYWYVCAPLSYPCNDTRIATKLGEPGMIYFKIRFNELYIYKCITVITNS